VAAAKGTAAMVMTKGVVLAGGAGSRLHPMTRVASKQLQPVYDKPMIYYPLATLMEAGIREILVITTPQDAVKFQDLLGSGDGFGIAIEYAVQAEPRGIAEAFLIAEDFIATNPTVLILGDNIFYGEFGLDTTIRDFTTGAVIFGYPVRNPEQYGVVEVDVTGRVLGLEEKPSDPRSKYAVPGLYVYDSQVVDIARSVAPSARGEIEITDINRTYLEQGQLRVVLMDRGVAWLDSGTHDSLLDAANFVATVEHRQSIKIACLEEIALRAGYLDRKSLNRIVADMPVSGYREYLERVLEEP
jgi:glucose-1-phosphate thymidylyltransferase